MAVFPAMTSVGFGSPVAEEIQFRTLMTEFADLGKEQRKQKWLYPKRLITLRYPWLSLAEVQTLFQFYITMAGAYGLFKFFHPSTFTYVHEYVGTGDDSTTIFNLPAKYSANYTLYIDGVGQQAGGVDYTFAAGGGPDGEDKATFVSAPDSGERITFSFTGNLKIVGRFQDD